MFLIMHIQMVAATRLRGCSGSSCSIETGREREDPKRLNNCRTECHRTLIVVKSNIIPHTKKTDSAPLWWLLDDRDHEVLGSVFLEHRLSIGDILASSQLLKNILHSAPSVSPPTYGHLLSRRIFLKSIANATSTFQCSGHAVRFGMSHHACIRGLEVQA